MFINQDQVLLDEELLGKPVNEDDPHVKHMRLFRDNVKLATYCVKKFSPSYDGVVDFEDLHQVAYMALWESCITYDDTRGKFSTYAVPIINGRLLVTLRNSNAVKLPRSYISLRSALRKYNLTVPLTPEEVDFLVNNTRCSRDVILSYADLNITSLDAPLEGKDSEGSSLYELIADSPESKYEALDEDELDRAINDTLMLIKPEWRDIVEEWIYATLEGEHFTQGELGEKYNVSRTTIHRILNTAIRVFRMNKSQILKIYGEA